MRLFERADIITELLHKFPARAGLLDVLTMQARYILRVECSFHRHNSLEFVAHRFDVAGLQHFGVHGALVSVIGKYIPRTYFKVFQISKRHNLAYALICFLVPTAYTNLGHLRD